MTDSRSKGKRAELEAAKMLTELIGVPFRRTQQFNGLGKGDVEPFGAPCGIHFEVKHYRAGLSWWVKRAAQDVLHVAGGLVYCEAKALPKVLRERLIARSSVTCGFVERWMAQAVADAKEGEVPLVVCRQDHSPWLLVWREEDDSRLLEAVRRLANAPDEV
jgi:hypothetical protein